MHTTAISPQLLQRFTSPATTQHQSFFISFEGIEGAGKSTQIHLFKNFLQECGYTVHLWREPGGTTFGEKLREVMLSSPTLVSPLAQALLFASARAQLWQEKIAPALQHPRSVVLVDRYIDSSLVYQGLAQGLGVEQVLTLHSMPPLCYLPHLTFSLEVDVSTALARLQQRGQVQDYFESKGEKFLRELLSAHQQVQALFPQRIRSIASTATVEEVAQQIQTLWQQWLQQQGLK